MGEGLHMEERRRALGPYHSPDRYFRAERALDFERHLPDPRFRLHPVGQAESLLGLDRLLLHQLSNRERQSLRGDRTDDGEEPSRERGTVSQLLIGSFMFSPRRQSFPLSSFARSFVFTLCV